MRMGPTPTNFRGGDRNGNSGAGIALPAGSGEAGLKGNDAIINKG